MSTKYWSVQRKASWRRTLNNNTTHERRICKKKPMRQIKIRQVLPHLPLNLKRTKSWSVICLWTQREVENGSVSIQTLLTFSVDANKCKNNMIYTEEQWGLNHKRKAIRLDVIQHHDKKWTASTNEKNFAKSWLQSPSHNLFIQQHDQCNFISRSYTPCSNVFFFIRWRLKETGQKYEYVSEVLKLRPSDDLFFPETLGDSSKLDQ